MVQVFAAWMVRAVLLTATLGVVAVVGTACSVNFKLLPKDADFLVQVRDMAPQTRALKVALYDANRRGGIRRVERDATNPPSLLRAFDDSTATPTGPCSAPFVCADSAVDAPVADPTIIRSVWLFSNLRGHVLVAVNPLDEMGNPVGEAPICLCLKGADKTTSGAPPPIAAVGFDQSVHYPVPQFPTSFDVRDFRCDLPCPRTGSEGENELEDESIEADADDPETDDPGDIEGDDTEVADESGDPEPPDTPDGTDTDNSGDTADNGDTADTEEAEADPLAQCGRYSPTTFRVEAEGDLDGGSCTPDPPDALQGNYLPPPYTVPFGELREIDASVAPQHRFRGCVVVLGKPADSGETSDMRVGSKITFKVEMPATPGQVNRRAGCYYPQLNAVYGKDFGRMGARMWEDGKESEAVTLKNNIDLYIRPISPSEAFPYESNQAVALSNRPFLLEAGKTYLFEFMVESKAAASEGFRLGFDNLDFRPFIPDGGDSDGAE